MSDLREAIRTIIYESDTDKLPGAVLAVITAHMAVTDADAIEMWHTLDQAHGMPAHDAMKAALEAFVVRKLKAETT